MTFQEDRTAPLPPPESDAAVIRTLREQIVGGDHWYRAILTAIGLWSTAEEVHQGQRYRYLVAGEAFDWLQLAQRLCQEVYPLIPEDEMQALLFRGEPPLEIAIEEFRDLIGTCKYRQYLNFLYGIVVEEARLQVVQNEVRKAQQVWAPLAEAEISGECYRRIYGSDKTTLLERFRREKGYRRRNSISLDELNEFHYWLFKYRLHHAEKARTASDTRKGLEWLQAQDSPWLRHSVTVAPPS